jgi:hypothetical protein
MKTHWSCLRSASAARRLGARNGMADSAPLASAVLFKKFRRVNEGFIWLIANEV